jgi:hypothetical protein
MYARLVSRALVGGLVLGASFLALAQSAQALNFTHIAW